MADLWLALLPILLALSISPMRTIIVIILLHTPQKALTTFAFVCGMITAMMSQGFIFVFLFSFVGLTMDERGPELSTLVSVLFILVAIILLTGAGKFIFQEEDDDKPPPVWLEKVENITPRKGFSTGFGWLVLSPKQWAFVLTAVAVIFTANFEPKVSLVNYFIFSVLIQVVYVIIIGFYLLVPKLSERIMDVLFNWIKNHVRLDVIGLFGAFGLFFLIKGISGLMA